MLFGHCKAFFLDKGQLVFTGVSLDGPAVVNSQGGVITTGLDYWTHINSFMTTKIYCQANWEVA